MLLKSAPSPEGNSDWRKTLIGASLLAPFAGWQILAQQQALGQFQRAMGMARALQPYVADVEMMEPLLL